MPLIRRDPPAAPPPDGAAPIAADPAALVAALATEAEPRRHEALLTALLRHGEAAPLLPLLRAEDAGLRGSAITVLQAMPDAVRPHLPALLADPDPDIRVLAAELARFLPAADATALLTARLAVEDHPNACAAVIEVLAERGTPDAVPALRALALRMAGDPFLPFAVAATIARLGGEPG